MPISIALLTGAVAMILAEILTPDEAYHAIVMTVLFICIETTFIYLFI